jgi:hypothetical protein
VKTRPELADVKAFYETLTAPVEAVFGKRDPMTLSAIVGFSAGGPVSLFTFGAKSGAKFVTYLSCELACYEDQKRSSAGPFELLMTCNDEAFARTAMTAVGDVSLAAPLDDGHSIDLGPKLDEASPLQGVVLERFSTTTFGRKPYAVLRAIGVTRAELDYCRKTSVAKLIDRLKGTGVHPNTEVGRRSLLL